jgi:hypothetical protein
MQKVENIRLISGREKKGENRNNSCLCQHKINGKLLLLHSKGSYSGFF